MDASANQPKILIVGRHNRGRSKLLEAYLSAQTRRFGVISAGVDPGEELDPAVVNVMKREGIDPPDPKTHSLGQLIDEPLILIVFVSESVRRDSPVIAAPCEKRALDLPEPGGSRSDSVEERESYYRSLLDRIRGDALGTIEEALPVDEIGS